MPETQPGRRVYFSAEDHASLADSPTSAQQQRQTMEATRRQNLAENLIRKAEQVAAAVKTLRSMDGTGNTQHALPHLQTTVADLNAAHLALITDVTKGLEKYDARQRMTRGLALAAAAEADHPAGAAAAAPAPGGRFHDQGIIAEAAARLAAGKMPGDFVAISHVAAKPGPRA
jgi:hypothetical protein